MMNTNLRKQRDVWEKWAWLWQILFYATVIISFALMLRDADRSGPVWVAAMLTTLLLLWHRFGIKIAYRDLTEFEIRPLPRLIIILGGIVLWFVLVNLSVAYYLALFGLFGQVFRHLPIRFSAPAALLLTVATIVEQLTNTGESFTINDATLWLFLFMGLGTIGLGIWIWAIIDQSTRRRELIEQLEATRAELAAAERREGVLEERQRMAREIHDTLAQGFTSIVMHLEAAEQALPADLDRLRRHLDQARTTARTSLDQARRVVQDLRPDLLAQHSLQEAVERTAVHWQEETGVPATVNVTGSPVPLHANIEVTLLRAVQEALNNVRKHARASAVQLTLSYMNDVVILDIQDDGVGIGAAMSSPLSGGFGLQAMRERAGQCGGSVVVESDPGEGTTITVTIPLAGAEQAISHTGGSPADSTQEPIT